MNQQKHEIGRLAYEEATHAPLHEWYVGGGFETAGDEPASGKPWRLDPDTGAEIHAIQRSEPHTYLTDYRVGASYDQTTFVFADSGGEPASHDDLEAFLREHSLWSDALHPIVVPNGGGELRPGFMFRPPGHAPYNLDGIKESIGRKFDLGDHEVLGNDRGFQAFVG